jgi:MerR family Zn(II)-responsive transcriptional regulator of zntA
MLKLYNIGQVVKKLKINKETIRYYEKIGLLKETKRDSNGYRIYTAEDIEILQFILMVKEYDFTLKEIAILLTKLFPKVSGLNRSEIRDMVDNKINEIDKKIEELSIIRKVLTKVKNNVLINKDICYIGKSIDEIINS